MQRTFARLRRYSVPILIGVVLLLALTATFVFARHPIFPLETPVTIFPLTVTPTVSPTASSTMTVTPTLIYVQGPTFAPSITKQPPISMGFCVHTSSGTAIFARTGPGTAYPVLGALADGTCLYFSARTRDRAWAQIAPVQEDPALQRYAGGWIPLGDLATLIDHGNDPGNLPVLSTLPASPTKKRHPSEPPSTPTSTPRFVITFTPIRTRTPGAATASAGLIRLTIDPGQISTSRAGVINPNETIHYVISATQGQMLRVKLTAPANEVAIGINGPTGLTLKPMDASPTWSTVVTQTGDYYINIMSLAGGKSKPYTLEVSLTGTVATPSGTQTSTSSTETPAPTPNVTQTFQAAFEEVDTQFKESLRANIAYNVPRTMKLGDTITIELLLKPSQYQLEQATQLVEQKSFLTSTAEAGLLATKVVEEGGFLTSTAEAGQPVGRQGEEQEVFTGEVIITPLMKAVLTSLKPGAFEIQPLQDTAEQPISSIDTTRWRWSITAKEEGEQTLEIEISRLLKQDNNGYWHQVEAYRADINVQVTASQWLKSLDWKWILGILVTALIIPLFFRWYDQRQKKAMADSHPQDKSERGPAKKSKPVSDPRSSKGKRSRK